MQKNYCSKAEKQIWWGTELLLKNFLAVFDDENYSRSEFVEFIRNYCNREGGSAEFTDCCMQYRIQMAKKSEKKEVKFETDTALNFLGGVVQNMLSSMKLDEIKEQVGKSLQDDVRKFILDNYGPIQRKVEFQLGERKTELKGVQHSKFETVLKFVQMNEPVFLTGLAGSGKNVICKQVADVLGLDFYFSNAVTQEYKGKSASKDPVSARFLSTRQNVYWNTNKPELVREIMGLKEETARGAVRKKSKYKILPSDYEITEKTKIEVFVEEAQIAEYYRRLWLHRITGKGVSVHLCVLVDGMIGGFIGLDYNAIIKPYRETDKNTIILSYAVPAPNTTCRLARLLVELIKSKRVITEAVDNKAEFVGVTERQIYEKFCDTLVKFGRTKNVTSIGTALSMLIDIATKEIENANRETKQVQ